MEELNAYIIKNSISIDKQNVLKKLYQNNSNLLKNINIDFINSDYFDKLDFYLLQAIVSLEESVQLNFLKITNDKRKLFYQIISRFSKQYYQFPYINSLLINFNDSKFTSLLDSIDINTLTEEDILNLNYILTSKENVLNIQSIDDVRNINSILEQKIEISKNNNLADYKNYMLLKKTNLSLSEIKLICQKYCYDLNHFHIDDSLIDNLKKIKQIVQSKSFEEVDKLINDLNIKRMAYPDFQTLCQNLYEKEFDSVLFNPNNREYKMYEDCKIVDAGVNFNMIIRTNGALSDSNTSLAPNEYWNNNVRDSLSFSTSLLSNEYLRNVSFFSNNVYVIGFSNVPKNSMVQCCMGDNATIYSRSKTLDARSFDDEKKINPNTGDACGQQFRPLAEMIKHGAGEYQEVTLERFIYEEGKESRLQPSYVLYFKKNDDYQNSSDFKKSLDAAKSFDIPLVIIDIKKVLLNEKEKIEKLLFNDLSIDNIIDAISRYSNIIHSFSSEQTQNILPEIFKIESQKEAINNMINNYLLFLEQKNLDRDFYQKLFDKLMILNDEKKCIKPGILIKLKNKYNLVSDFEKYSEIVYGITYKEHAKTIITQYEFEETEKIFDFILENNLELTDSVYNNSKINSIVKSCKTNNIPLTQEVLSYSWDEYEVYLKKVKTIEALNSYPTENEINKLFALFSLNEIKRLLQPIIDRVVSEKKNYLIEIIKTKLKEYNLEEDFTIQSEKTDLSDSSWDDDWADDWNDDFKETTSKKM